MTWRALTFVQPWATAIMLHGKNIENRRWAPRSLLGKRFAVHAGKSIDTDDAWNLQHELDDALDMDKLPLGALLGTVELVGYLDFRPLAKPLPQQTQASSVGLSTDQQLDALSSRWASKGSLCLWVLRNPLVLETPIPCKGARNFWRVPDEHVAALDELERGNEHAHL